METQHLITTSTDVFYFFGVLACLLGILRIYNKDISGVHFLKKTLYLFWIAFYLFFALEAFYQMILSK